MLYVICYMLHIAGCRLYFISYKFQVAGYRLQIKSCILQITGCICNVCYMLQVAGCRLIVSPFIDDRVITCKKNYPDSLSPSQYMQICTLIRNVVHKFPLRFALFHTFPLRLPSSFTHLHSTSINLITIHIINKYFFFERIHFVNKSFFLFLAPQFGSRQIIINNKQLLISCQ